MDDIAREIAELEARIALFRATPHKELPMIAQLDPPTTIRLPAAMWRQIDRLRSSRGDQPTRSQIIRELVDAGLAAKAAERAAAMAAAREARK